MDGRMILVAIFHGTKDVMCGQSASVIPRSGRCHVTERLCDIFVPKKPPKHCFFERVFQPLILSHPLLQASSEQLATDVVATSPAAAHLWAPERSRLSFPCLHELEVTIFTGHFTRYTYRVGPSFALRTASILRSIDLNCLKLGISR